MLIVILVIILLLILLLYIDNNRIKVKKYEYTNNKIPKSFDGYKIVHLSDIHSKKFGKNNRKLIDKINEINPDIIIMSGDIVDKRKGNIFEYANSLDELFKKYKAYYAIGNHELGLIYPSYKNYINYIEKLGAYVIIDGKEKLYKDNDYIVINALRFKMNYQSENMIGKKREYQIEYMKNKLKPIDESKFNILIAHDPENFDMYKKIHMDLIFSGHVHGGIIRIGKICLFSPRRKFFPKYSYGMTTEGSTTIITSAGMGKATLPIRVFNPPEIGIITLKC